MAEVKLFYEKIVEKDAYSRADFIEGVVAGIGGALGGKEGFKELKPLLSALRGGKS